MKKTQALIAGVIITLWSLPLFGAASITLTNSSSTATNYPLQYGQPFVQGEITTCPQVVFDGTPLTSQADVKERWTDGSVKHAILAAVISSVTNGAHTVTYQPQACSNTALTKTQMLAGGYDFNAQMLLTNSFTVTADARTMLSAWDGTTQDYNVQSPVQLWTSGQVAQSVIITLHGNSLTCNTHPCSTYDIGTDANKSFRPIFHATFWPATNQVHVRYIGEIANSETLQDQTYSLALTAGNASPTTVYTKTSFTQSGSARWTKDFWIGGTPPSTISINPNLAYLKTTKFVPNYDTTTALNSGTATTIAALWANLSAADKDIGGKGNWTKSMPDAGARLDIGPYPSWTVDYLYAGTAGLQASTYGNADLQASWPIHVREGKTGKILNLGDTGSTGLGKVISISGRPTMCLNGAFLNFGADPSDAINLVGSGSSQGWTWDAAHLPEYPVVNYILTGDFWYLEESMFNSSLLAGAGYKSQYYRGPTGATGSLMYQQLRAMAWNLRSWSNLAFVIPDAMAEKQYFTQLILDSVALEEGIRNITTGSYNGTTLWTYGRNTMAPNGATTTFDSNGIASTLHQYVRGSSDFAQNEYGICSSTGAGTPCSPATVSEAASFFETDYMMFALGRCKELGYTCDALLTWASSLQTGMLTNSGFNPYILDNGRVPTYTISGTQFTTFTQLKTGYDSNWQARTGYGTGSDPDGYLAYATAGMSFMTNETNGQTSWNFLLANGISQATFALDPKWHVAPRSAPTCAISGVLTNGTVGVSYGTQTLTSSNCGGGTITWSVTSGSLPTGLSLCSTGLACSVTGTPTTISGSPFSGVIRATDGGSNTAFFNFNITISPATTAPTITSTSPLPNAVNGSAYSYQFTATGTPTITWSATGVPAGLTLSASGLLSGTPTITAVNTIAVTATNGTGSAGPTNFSLTVNPGGNAPVITSSSPLPTAVVGVFYSVTFTATGTATITWTATGPLPWANLATNGVMTGTPGVSDVGTVTIAVTATNSIGSNTKNFSITTNQKPTITSTSPLPSGVNGTAYSYQFTATGTPTPTWSATGVPAGLTLSAGGLLSGTPTVTAGNTVAVTATNSAGSAGPTNFSLTIAAATVAPTITSTSPLPTAVVGVAYSYQFTFTGSPITTSDAGWTATGIPAWATLTKNGLLSGNPPATGTPTIAVSLATSGGTAGPSNFSLPILQAPLITTTSSTFPGGTNGVAYSYQFTATGSATITWTATGLPAWASLSSGGLLTGTPNAVANTTIAVTATNSVGHSGPINFLLVIVSIPVAPTITTTSPLTQGVVGTTYNNQIAATGDTPITFSVTGGSLPTGLALDGATGIISGTPVAAATSSFTVLATNGAGSNSKIFSLTSVFPQGSAPAIVTACPLTSASTGVAYSLQTSATGLTPITWDLSTGSFPAGISMSANGLISGTPTAGGTSSFTLRATNVAGVGIKVCSLIVNSVPVLDYSISTTGPQHVVVGHYSYFNVVGNVLTGTDEAVTPSVSGLPTGVLLVWTNLIKFCCTTFRFGINGLNPAQLIVASVTIPGTYTLTITYNSNISHIVRTATHTLIVDAVPPALTMSTFPANSALTGLAQWQTNMINFGHTYCTPPLGGPAFEGFVWYYDGTRNYYQIAAYTGDPQWLACAQGLDALYQAYVLQIPPLWTGTAGNLPGYHVFPRGLQVGYTTNGVVADSTAIQALQTNGYANFGDVSQVIDFLLSREISYGLETNLEAENVGIPRIANFQNVVEVLIGDFDQWFQSQTAPFAQPFMVGLAAEALIQYYDTTGDVRVPPLIKLAADQLRSVSYDPLTTSFMYYNQGGTPSSPYDPQCSNYSSSGTGHTCKGPSPDLNLLIVPIYGWVYQHTGDISYRTFGDIIFNAGVSGGFLGAGKQFSQNYRWSEKYINWRDTGGSVTISGSVVLGGGVTVH